MTGPNDPPVFAAPWQAQAFAMAVKLAEAGHFTWSEWTETISAEIAAAQRRGDPDTGETYYEHWLAALERLVAAKRLAAPAELADRKAAWADAAAHTPHGEPIILGRD
jgi:nitrile hydratase accessory protein